VDDRVPPSIPYIHVCIKFFEQAVEVEDEKARTGGVHGSLPENVWMPIHRGNMAGCTLIDVLRIEICAALVEHARE
jgi:hypothetical protein